MSIKLGTLRCESAARVSALFVGVKRSAQSPGGSLLGSQLAAEATAWRGSARSSRRTAGVRWPLMPAWIGTG